MNYPGKESPTLEFKKGMPKNNQIIKTVIAFCNQFGGKIILGVEDNGHIIGMPEDNINQQIDSLQESIFKSCSPVIIPAIYTQRITEKLIIIIEVSKGMNKPYFLLKEGLTQGTYIRIGTSTIKANAEMIQEIQWKSRGHSLDELPIYSANRTDLDENLVNNFLQTKGSSFQINQQEEYLLHYKLLIEEHTRVYPSTAGILLFGKDPQAFITEAFIICTHFKGKQGREALATFDCTGTLFQQLRDCMAFLEKRLFHHYKIEKIKRDEQLEVPKDALREIVINAIVHRNYQIPGPTKVAIYDDRIEIFSPGTFPGPLKINQLEMGLTYLRNKILCRIFREAGLIEKLGSGFQTLFKRYREYKLPKPQIIEGMGFIKCILPRSGFKQQEDEFEDNRMYEVMQLFKIVDKISVTDVTKQLSVSRQTAVRILNNLINTGLITRQGKGRAVTYTHVH